MQERIKELTKVMVGVVNAADFDVNYFANEFGYTTGEIMRTPNQTKSQLLHWESEWRHPGLLGFYKMSGELFDLGFKYCGHGYFSSAFTHDDTPGVVYKLSMRTDDAYAAFALWARANPDKHAPTFYDIQRGSACVVFAIKKYVSLSYAQSLDLLPDAFAAYSLMGRVRANKPNTLYRRDIVKYLRSVMKFFSGVAKIDVHGDNLMYDPSTRRIIVTDPVSFTHSAEEYSCF